MTKDNAQRTNNWVMCSIDATTIADDNIQRIHLIPVDADGMVIGLDGRAWKYNSAAMLAAASDASIAYPVDYHHASLNASSTGAKAPAAGWIDPATLEHVENSGLWGMVKWSDAAATAIKDREFRYTSPVFSHKDGATVAFKGSALTHYPNLENLTPVANTQQNNKETHAMEELLERLRYVLNLPTLATVEEVQAELDKGFAKLKAIGGDAAVNAETLPDIITGIGAMQVAANSMDAASFVPRSEFDRLRTELNTVAANVANDRVSVAVNDALESGVIAPASTDWAKNYCRSDPDGFSQFVAGASKVIPLGEDQHGTAANATLSEEEQAVCSQIGLSEEEFLKNKAVGV